MGTQLLIVSDGSLLPTEHITDAASMGVLTTVVENPRAALEYLRNQHTAVALDARVPGAEAFVSQLRTEHELAGVPVAALVRSTSTADFAEALSWGVDEVVPLASLHHLGDVVLAFGAADQQRARPPATRGTVLVACPTRDERRTRARPLRNVGYEVRFAADPDELAGALATQDVALVLADVSLFGATAFRSIRALRAADVYQRPWLLVVSPPEAGDYTGAFARERVAVMPRHAPPEDAIFAGNELLSNVRYENRASPRLLYSTVVGYRPAGVREMFHGVTYNVSREGLYLRTVTPPPPGTTLWLELLPPSRDALVHLEAEVVWALPFGRSNVRAPAGFGVRITDATRRDLERWGSGYARLLGGHGPPNPTP